MAIKFRGSKAVVPSHPSLDSGTEGFMAEVWFRGTTDGPLMNRRSGSNGWALEVRSDGLPQALVGATTVTGTSNVLDDEWHIASVEYDATASKCSLYVDGEMVGESAVSGYADASSDLRFAADDISTAYLTIGPARFVRFPVYRGQHVYSPSDEVDDIYTTGLWFFDENVPGTCWSYSAGAASEYEAPSVYNDASLVGSLYDWVDGPFGIDVESRSRMILWRAIESHKQANDAMVRRGVMRHRARRGDKFLTAGAFGGRLAEFVPGVWISPTDVDRSRATIAYDVARVGATVQVVGQIFWYDNLRGMRATIARAIDDQWVGRSGPMAHGLLNSVTIESASRPVTSAEQWGGTRSLFVIADIEVQLEWVMPL